MEFVETSAALRDYCARQRRQDHLVGFVPTMGFLHAGHLSLIARAKHLTQRVVVSIFVNPTQFAPHEDLRAYPRDFERDLAACRAAGVDVVFAPTVGEMYPEHFQTTVAVAEMTRGLCGAFRPGHFTGVCTVVAKLFNIVGPCTAFFGEKDYQQLFVLKRMVSDLNIPVDIVSCPTVRESDGLALSSRNSYLDAAQRRLAPRLQQALSTIGARYEQGAFSDPAQIITLATELIAGDGQVEIQYIEVRHAETLAPLLTLGTEPAVVAIAAWVGKTRLIDNLVLAPKKFI